MNVSERMGVRRRALAMAGTMAWLIWLAGPVAAQEHEHEAGAHAAAGEQAKDSVAMTGDMAEPAGPPALPSSNDLVEVRVDRDARTMEIVVGPVSLPAGSPHLRTPVQLASLPVAGWLHGFEWEIRDRQGRVLPERLLHHVNLIDPDHRELFSPIARRIMAAGRETKSESMPKVLGLPLEEGARVLVSAMFAPRPDESFDEAYLHVVLRYTPADDPGLIRPRDVYPFYMDVMGPVGDKDFPLPPGTHRKAWEGRPAIGGRLLAVGGHLHDYADWIRLEDVTTGKVLWEAEPEKTDGGGVTGVPTGKLWWRGGVRIRPDHVYRLVVQYTNPLDRPAPDAAMGALGGIILADDAAWPPFDRENPDYVTDLRNTLEKPNEAHGHGEHAAMEMGGS